MLFKERTPPTGHFGSPNFGRLDRHFVSR